MLEKLLNLDRRYIFICMAVAVVLPVFLPMRLEVIPTESAKAGYHFIEALPDGSNLLLSVDYGPSTKVECHPMVIAVLHQAFRKNMKVATMSIWPEGQPYATQALNEVAPQYDKRYGLDYVDLGYKAGNDAVLVSLGIDFRGLFKTDLKGNRLADLPMMQSIFGLRDFAAVGCYSAGRPGALEHIKYTASQYGMPLIIGCTAVQTPEYYTYFSSGQLKGLLGGMRGAAEYEVLANVDGTAVPGMDAQSIAHFTIAFFIIFSNVVYFLGRGKRR